MALKRKAVAKSAQDTLGRTRGKGYKKALEEVETPAEEEEPEQQDAEMEEEGEEEPDEEISEEERLAKQEEQIKSARTKELKSMAAADLKELVIKKGLDAGKKEENVAAIVALEAKERETKRVHEARLRAVVVKKKEELEGLSFPELAERCRQAGITGRLSKQDRIQQLMAKWQQEDGINKGLEAMALEERQAELSGLDKTKLASLCTKKGVDPLLKEVMVDRLVKHESAAGRFARPDLHSEEHEDEKQDTKGSKGDLVDAVLANESSRKKQKELKRQQEEAESNKRNDLLAKSIDELKKLLTKKGLDATGKKTELVETLLSAMAHEEATAARKAKLRAMSLDELKRMLADKKVEVAKGEKKDAMIQALFAHEAKTQKELELFQEMAAEVEAKKKEELQALSASELKDLCSSKGLRLGVGKDDRVTTLLEAARADGETDKLVAAKMRHVRRDELLAMEKGELKGLCDEAGVDTVVKDVVIERILSYEGEHGRIDASVKGDKPPAKKARVSKK